MKLNGMLSIMSLPDLLQWIKNSRKTGRLHLAHKGVSRDIYCRDGRVVACASEDPSVLLGQFLLCHDRISEATLREGLERQERTGETLGGIFVEVGALTHDDLAEIIRSKAMETIHGLFDWEDASFEFTPDATLPAGRIEVDLCPDGLLLEGARRFDEMVELRRIFHSPRLVLIRTDLEPDPALFASSMARKLHDAIDGRRTLAEVVLRSHASEFIAFKFLRGLLDRGAIEVAGTREVRPTEIDPAPTIDRATQLMSQDDFVGAIEILWPLAESRPDDASIRSLLADAEAKFVVKTYRGGLHPGHVPVVRPDTAIPSDQLTGAEAYLLDRIDGRQDIRSILWVVPMRPVEALAAFKSLVDRGLIEVQPVLSGNSAEPNSGQF